MWMSRLRDMEHATADPGDRHKTPGISAGLLARLQRPRLIRQVNRIRLEIVRAQDDTLAVPHQSATSLPR
jgi:hypothetical protein